MRRWLTLLALVPMAVVLVRAAVHLPALGDPDAPAAQHVSPRYIEQGPGETGAPNLVTGILADYRSFDTLGETVVVLAAGLACVLLMAVSVLPRHGEDS